MSKVSSPSAPSRAKYSDATERTFRGALKKLEATLPDHCAGLGALVDAGRFDDLTAIVAVLEGGSR